MTNLRPIGTVFQYEFPPALSSSECRKSRITYRVTAHVKLVRFIGDEEGVLSEELEALEIEWWDGKEWAK